MSGGSTQVLLLKTDTGVALICHAPALRLTFTQGSCKGWQRMAQKVGRGLQMKLGDYTP